MIPLRQTTAPRVVPTLNRSLVAANVLMFAAQWLMGPLTEKVIATFGFVPARLFDPGAYGYMFWEVGVTLFTSLFLHGGFVHLLGNMIYLWVFGSAIEEEFGRSGYFFFFLTAGAAGSVTHALLFSGSAIPSVGASGSIAGILGAFLILRPHAQIVTLFPLVVYWAMAEIPSILFIPVWFATQFFNGFLSLDAARATQEVAGVAWWAHIGGFLFGALVAFLFRVSNQNKVAVRH